MRIDKNNIGDDLTLRNENCIIKETTTEAPDNSSELQSNGKSNQTWTNSQQMIIYDVWKVKS